MRTNIVENPSQSLALTLRGEWRPTGMMNTRIVRKPFMAAVAMITGIVALGFGYKESQAAAKFVFDAAAVRQNAIADEGLDAVVAAPSAAPLAAAPAKPKMRKAPKAEPPTPEISRNTIAQVSSDVSDEQGGLMLAAALESRIRMSIRAENGEAGIKEEGPFSQAHIEALKLMAAATRERFDALHRAVPGAIVFERAERPSGN